MLVALAATFTESAVVPRWTASHPDYQKPLAGLPPVVGAEHTVIFEPTPEDGTYSHGAQITRFENQFHVSWNNCPFNEDGDGMRLLYSSSEDGRIWSQPIDVFPSMPAKEFAGPTSRSFGFDKIHHHAAPFVNLHGRLYAVSNLRRHGGFEIYPVPADDLNTTLLRRVLQPARRYRVCPQSDPPAWCNGTMRWSRPAFGPIYWATDAVMRGLENITQSFGIRSAASLTPEEQADFALFRDVAHARSMSPASCRGGPCGATTGEQTIYSLPGNATDIILYRGKGGTVPAGWPGDQSCTNASDCVLLSSSRDTSAPLTSSPWSAVAPTTIPDLGSNLAAGSLVDSSGVYLVWNGVPRPHVNDTACARQAPLRNPLTLALSKDGVTFDRAFALYNNTRPKRFCGSAKAFGPSYPKAVEVAGEGAGLDGLWTVYSINKEDIGVTFAPRASLDV